MTSSTSNRLPAIVELREMDGEEVRRTGEGEEEGHKREYSQSMYIIYHE